MRIGALVKALLKDEKASSAAGDQDRDLGLSFNKLVSGLEMVL